MASLRRSLGLFDATMVNVGVMIGATIFLTAADVARLLPHPLLQLAAWVVAALFSLSGALTMAELGASLPRAGGLYVYLGEAFGPAWGFLYGWALFVVIQTAAIAAVAVAFASYASHFVPLGPAARELCAALTVGLITAINVLGVRTGVITQNVVTLCKVGLMIGLLALALFLGGADARNLTDARAPIVAANVGWGAFGAALIGPLFAFDGWISTSYMAGELAQPTRTLPRAAFASVVLVAILYFAVNATYLAVLGASGVATSKLVAAETAHALLGARGADLAAAMVVIATLGSLHGLVLSGARVTYAMADEGLFWRAAARIHPRFATPAVALAAQGAVATALVFAGGFERLLTACLFASWLFYAMGGLALFVLRRRPDLPRPYRVWGYPVLPAVFVAFAAYLLIATVAAAPRDAALGSALLATGLPAYWLFRRHRGATRAADPQ